MDNNSNNYYPPPNKYDGYPPPQDKKGCRVAMAIVGWLLVVASVIVIALSVLVMYQGDVAQRDREQASKEYYEKYGEYFDVPDSLAVNDSSEIAVETIAARDSLLETIPAPPPVGFNIAAAFGMFFIIICLIPLVIGIILLVVANRMKRRLR